jgi:uncharacterized membrane protein SpoIIM required for sporulation
MAQGLEDRPTMPAPYYGLAAIVSAALGFLAMFVGYQILGSDFWTRALGHGLFEAPPVLFDVSLVKVFEVIVGVLAAHLLLKAAGVYRRDPMAPTVFALSVLASASIGFLVTYNNAEAEGLSENWLWLFFACVVFFTVAAIAALYLQLAERYFLKCLRQAG